EEGFTQIKETTQDKINNITREVPIEMEEETPPEIPQEQESTEEQIQEETAVIIEENPVQEETIPQETEEIPQVEIQRISLNGSDLIGEIISYNGRYFVNDKNGKVSSLNREGLLWQYSSMNANLELTRPVVGPSSMVLAGKMEVVFLNSNDGSLLFKADRSTLSPMIFGQVPLAVENVLYYPLHQGLARVDMANGNILSKINMNPSSSMTPAIYENKILLADSLGTLQILNAQDLSLQASVSTSATQPAAMETAIYDGKALFAGRQGPLVCIDIDKADLLWEQELPFQPIYQSPRVNSTGIFVFAGGNIVAFDWQGRELYRLTDATAPPLLEADSMIWADTSGMLHQNRLIDGVEQNSYNLDQQIQGPILRTAPGELMIMAQGDLFFLTNAL
ncbi:MAG: PQQ-binding-like beta-propeller repeat protein, partial [Spirochaetaceae bacterium]|nr:PQQ-binding-like beta-propeller repeat protein [Spirochaetaceae bacterium]